MDLFPVLGLIDLAEVFSRHLDLWESGA